MILSVVLTAVVVGLVMAFYAWVQRRTQRWLA